MGSCEMHVIVFVPIHLVVFQVMLYNACLEVHYRSRHYLGVQKSPHMLYPMPQNVSNVAMEIVPIFDSQQSLLAILR